MSLPSSGSCLPVTASRDLAADGLRGLAALMVLYHHLMGASVQGWSPPSGWTWPVSGPAAVLVFFALSGYVIGITNPAEPTGERLRSYVGRRGVRLMPVNVLAVLMGCAASSTWGIDTVVSHLLFLESYVDYAGRWVPVMDGNGNLWSLNHEVVCYALFVVVWVTRARLTSVAVISLLLVGLGWYSPYVPLFVACYAAGFLFWLTGLAISRTGRADEERSNWPSALLIALVTWKLETLRQLAGAFPLPYFIGPTVKLYHLDFLPVTAWLLANVTRRTFPLLPWARRLALVIPLIGLIAHALDWPARTMPASSSSAAHLWPLLMSYLVALATLNWRRSLRVFRAAAPIGAISYALYACSRPIEHLVFRHAQFLPPNALGFTLGAVTVCVLSFTVAWYVERRLQPAVRQAMGFGPRPTPTPIPAQTACAREAVNQL